MAFQIKDFRSIAAAMINHARATQHAITDFNVGSVIRTLLETPAIEMDELYQQMFAGLMEAIPVSVYRSFEFDALPAESAGGLLRFSSSAPVGSPVTVPSGTSASRADGRRYTTTVSGTITIGNTSVDIHAAADDAGVDGNTEADTITQLVSGVTGISGVTNPNRFTGGRDVETDEDRQARFNDYIQSLARGTVSAVLYGAKSAYLADGSGNITESVKYASLVEPWRTDPQQPVGWIQLYIHNGVGGTTPALIDRVTLIIEGSYDANGLPIPGWKAAGVKMDVAAAAEILQAVTATVVFAPDADSVAGLASAEAAIRDYLLALDVGRDIIRAEIVSIVMAFEGVYNVAVATPAADVTVAVSQKAMPGAITLTAGSYAP